MADIGRLISSVVDELAPERDESGCTNLNRLAARLGATDIVYRATQSHGFTEWTAAGPRVVVANAATDGRRRATLAHECGHLMIDWLLTPRALQSVSSMLRAQHEAKLRAAIGSAREDILTLGALLPSERICDLLAYELIFPREEAHHRVDDVTSIDSLLATCDELRVSVSVAVLALNARRNERGLPAITVLEFAKVRDTESKWIATTALGAPREWRGRLVLEGQVARYIDALAPMRATRTSVTLPSHEGLRNVRAELKRFRNGTTFMFVDPQRPSSADGAGRPPEAQFVWTSGDRV